MKKFIITLAVLVVVAGTFIYMKQRKSADSPAPLVAEATPETAKPESVPAATAEPAQPKARVKVESAMVPASAPVITNAQTNVGASLPTPFGLAMDTLVSKQSTIQQREAAWKQLMAAGQLDQAIESLKSGMAQHPDAAEYPAELGRGQLFKAGEIQKSGGKVNEMGILGMQADQNFDAALRADPSNLDAQFYKAVAMSYWPAELNKGEEVAQRLASLIDQQEQMQSQPEFARTYTLLGAQYEKLGKSDYAEQTWRLGLQKFPNDPALREKVAGLRGR